MIKVIYKRFEIATLGRQEEKQQIAIMQLNKLLEILIQRQEPIIKLKNLTRLLIRLIKTKKLPFGLE